jgi:hypothetical protein
MLTNMRVLGHYFLVSNFVVHSQVLQHSLEHGL